MGAKIATHTFNKGMVKDLDKSLMSKEQYLDAHNYRLTTGSGESTGALENVEGNNNIYTCISPGTTLIAFNTYVVVAGTATYNSVNKTVGQTFTTGASPLVFSGAGSLVINANELMSNNMAVVGSTYVRDTIVLFITDNTTASPTTGRSIIRSLTINRATETITTSSVLYDDGLNGSTGYLKFSSANPIKAIGVYETPTIQKVYWCDGFNNVRYANTAAYLTSDGNVYSSGVNTYCSPDLFEFIPEATLSKPVLDQLSPGAITAGVVQYAYQYFTEHGSESSISPLSNTIHIVTDNDYQLGTYYYKGEGDLESKAGKSVKMTFNTPDSDKYDYIRVFRLHYKTINSVPTITIVGEVRIVAEASTVSFLDTGNTSIGTLTLDQLNIGETSLFAAEDIDVKSNRLFAANITNEEFDLGDWDARAVRFNTTPVALVTDSIEGNETLDPDFLDWSDYVSYHDGINPFNDPANDGNATYAYIYQADGTTLGAEGPNVKIGFTTDTVYLDKDTSANVYSAGIESTSDNKTYTNFASPYMSGRRSWQRDEVYRLYLVFYNAHGIASPAKWVCDLRMPSLHDTSYSTLSYYDVSNDVYTTALYPTVYLKSLPTGAVSAQLLRVERGGDDRSILTQCLVVPLDTVSGAVRPKVVNTALSTSLSIVKLVSPEINIYKNITRSSSDYLEYVTKYGTVLTADYTTYKYHKCVTNTQVAYAANTKTTIDQATYVTPRASADTFSFNSTTCANYDADKSAYGCSGMFVYHLNGSWTAEGNSYAVANYKRDVHNSQYGGQTFESREGNIAIPASDVLTAIETTYTAWNGDTFIDFFDVSTQLFDLTKTTAASYNENVYIPLESSINCSLRHDRSANRAIMDASNYLLQEVAGKWTNASGVTYEQTTPLYQYNTVYSQESNAKSYVNVPDEVSTDTVFDCMVKVSQVKLYGELRDSWTVFHVNDFIEVNTKHGPITALRNINDRLLFWQTNGFGVLSVNERSLIQDSGGASLVLGTGGILDRYDYISDAVGASDSLHIVPSQSGVYWLNLLDKSIYRFTTALENLSKSRLMQSWFESTLSPSNLSYVTVRSTYDKQYNQVLFSFYNSNTASGVTLAFDEVIDAFSGFYDYWTNRFITYKEGFLSTYNSTNVDFIFYHNSLVKEKCAFHSLIPGVASAEASAPSPAFVDSTIKVVFNDDYNYTKVFDNIAYVSTASLSGTELYNNTFSSLRCYNNYQNSDYWNITYGNTYTTSTGILPIQRDEREWTLFVPRNSVDKGYTTNPDIFSAGNLDKTRQFRERLRDKYMVTDFVYSNTANRRFVVPYISIKYRVSYR